MKRALLKLPPKLKPGPELKPELKPELRSELAPKTVAQQSTDFTAEGAPPPGKVGTDVPVDAAEQAHIKHEQAKQAQAGRG